MLFAPDHILQYGHHIQRGKFRPRLLNLVESNAEELVEVCSRKAFQHLPDLGKAISALTELKGVGPATASGKGCLSAVVGGQ